MKTLALDERDVTVQELLRWAAGEAVLIRDEKGNEFILEEADDLEREAAELGSNEAFMRFLSERSKEPGTITLDQIERELQAKGN